MLVKKGFGLIVGELRASLVSPGIIREGHRNPRRHSHSANLLKMRQVYNWLYLAGLIAILFINFSSQEPDQNSASGMICVLIVWLRLWSFTMIYLHNRQG